MVMQKPDADRIRKQIGQRLSLRKPQERSLLILAEVLEQIVFEKDADPADALAAIQALYPSVKEFERDFPSLCFALATGVGKTRLMGAFITYLFLIGRSRNFFVLAPNTTIYEKLIDDFTPGRPKYVFKGIAQLAQRPPLLVTGDNWDNGAAVRGYDLLSENLVVNIFNVDKINKDKGKVKRLHEYIGQSYFDYLSELPDLVLLMDEAHRYRAKAGMKAVAELKPVLGLELTATPKTVGAKSEPFKNVIYEYGLGDAMADGYVKEPAVATRSNFDPKSVTEDQLEQIKLEDGVHYHEHVKVELDIYARQSGRPKVTPFMLVVAQDTGHAKALRERIESATFFEGRYKGKVAEVHSALKGDENDEAMQRLVALERDGLTEIVIHVNKLKEGWDVTNLYTIVPLRASASDILTEQTLGRGLRLPYGERTGVEAVDTLTVIAHDRFDDVIRKAREDGSVVKVKALTIGEGGDVDDDKPSVYTAPSVADTLLTGQRTGSETSGLEEPSRPYIFEKPEERDIARRVLDAITHVERICKRGAEDLSNPEVEAKLVELTETMAAQTQGELGGIIERPDVRDIVRKVIEAYQMETISIPEIVVIPTREVTFGYKDFDLSDLRTINQQPISDEIQISNLRTENRTFLARTIEGAREDRLEDYIVRHLIEYDAIDYDSQADLLYKLAGQVVARIQSYLDDEADAENVCLVHGKDFARFIFEQMKGHYWETPTDYHARISSGFKALRPQAFNLPDPNRLLHFSKEPKLLSEIKKYVFHGFSRCCYGSQKFDSNDERKFACILEAPHETSILRWMKPASRQFEIEYASGQAYEPDFVVETQTEKLIVEVKARKEMQSEDVKAKARAALKWIGYANAHAEEVEGKPWRYILIPHDEIRENSTLVGLVNSWSAHSVS